MALNAFKQLEKKQKSKSCMFFIRSGPSFWKNKEQKKTCKTPLYDKMKEWREMEVNS